MLIMIFKKLRQSYADAKISQKIVWLNSMLFLLLLLILLIICNIGIRQLAIRYAAQNAVQSNAVVQEKIENLLTNAEDVSSLIAYNDIIQKQLLKETAIEQLDRIYPINNIMNKMVHNSSGISTIILCPSDKSSFITTDRVNLNGLGQLISQNPISEMESLWEQPLWSDMSWNTYQFFAPECAAVTLKKNIISIYTGQIIGTLVIDIPETKIAETYESELNDSYILLLNEDSQIISCTEKSLLLQDTDSIIKNASLQGTPLPIPIMSKNELVHMQSSDSPICKINNNSFLISTAPVEKLNWTIIRFTPIQNVYHQTYSLMLMTILAGFFAFILVTLGVRKIANNLMKPLLRLTQIMDEDSIIYNNSFPAIHNDEIGRLTKSFQHMQLRIQIMIERVKYEQHQQTQINMASLQTQINPHFLYNTLDSVCALLQMGHNKEAARMLKSIEMFYRGTLSKGSSVITLKDEIYVTEQYVMIQQYRYEGNLHVEFDISDEVLSCSIPKLTIQPILENAIYHGLKNGGRDGIIHISEEHTADLLTLKVTDNGTGFQPQSLEAPSRASKRGGFGLYNTHRRIRYYFGEAYGLEIESVIGKGTTVSIKIPNQTSVQERR